MGKIGGLEIFLIVCALCLLTACAFGLLRRKPPAAHGRLTDGDKIVIEEDPDDDPGTWDLMSTNDQVILVALVVIFWPAGLWYYWKRGDELRDQDTPSQ